MRATSWSRTLSKSTFQEKVQKYRQLKEYSWRIFITSADENIVCAGFQCGYKIKDYRHMTYSYEGNFVVVLCSDVCRKRRKSSFFLLRKKTSGYGNEVPSEE